MTLPCLNPDPTLRHALPTATELLRDTEGELHLRVSGRSMAPLIQPGDLLHVQAGNQLLIPGEVLVCQIGEQLYAHRLVRILKTDEGEESYLTKGDASIHFDQEVGKGAIIGKVIAIQRGEQHQAIDGKVWKVVNYSLAKWMWAWARAYQRRAPQHPFQGRVLSLAGVALFSTLLNVISYLSKAIWRFSRLLRKGGRQE